MAHPNRLLNARVLVFGGTSGIGYGVANMALSNGAQVIISGSTQEKVDAKVKELQSAYPNLPGSQVSGLACDLSDVPNLESNLKKLFDTVTENGNKKLDHVAFSAGNAVKLPTIRDFTVDEALAGFQMRFLGGAMIGKHLLTGLYMHRTTSSSLTLTSGTNSEKPFPDWSFGASWGCSVEGLSRGLAVDLRPIRVNVVAPGAIETPLLQKFVKNVGEERATEVRERGSLLAKFGSPEDLGETYGWLMRDWFVTGIRAESNGGRMLV